MKKLFLLVLLLTSMSISSQETIKEVLKKYNTESVPYLTVNRLKHVGKNVYILDAREQKEYKVSHIKNALFVGYDNFNLEETIRKMPNKKNFVVVYCTLGVRSEDIAEKLQKAGYTNVYNLFGGIVEWKNKGNNVYNSKEKETERVHVSSKSWGKWLLKGKKVY
jgi:rhodanese-related sulfurtransferase